MNMNQEVMVNDEETTRPPLAEEEIGGEGNEATNIVAAVTSQPIDDGIEIEEATPLETQQEEEKTSQNTSSSFKVGPSSTDDAAVRTTHAYSKTTKKHGGFTTTNMNTGKWNSLKRQQQQVATSHWHRKNIHSADSSSSSASTSATSSFTTRHQTLGSDDSSRSKQSNDKDDINEIGDNDDVDGSLADPATDEREQKYAMVVSPSNKKERPPKKHPQRPHKKRKEDEEAIKVVVRLGDAATSFWENLVGGSEKERSSNKGLETIGSRSSSIIAQIKFMDAIQDEQWRKSWRGIHLPPMTATSVDADGGGAKRKKDRVGSVPMQLAAPDNGDNDSDGGKAAKVDAPMPSPPDTPKAADQETVAVDRKEHTPPSIDEQVHAQQNPDIPRDTDRFSPSALPSSFSNNQPSVPLYPLLLGLILYYLIKRIFFQKIFTYKKRTLLVRSVKEKLSELRYGGSARQFRLSQNELDDHIRKWKTRNSSKSKKSKVSGGGDSGGGSSKDGRGDGDGNEGDMGGGGMGGGGSGGGSSSGSGGNDTTSNSNSRGGDDRGASRDSKGGKHSHNARSNNLGTTLCDRQAFLAPSKRGSEKLLHSANKQLAADAVRAKERVEELLGQLSRMKRDNASLTQKNASLSQHITHLEEEHDKEMKLEMELHEQLVQTQMQKAALAKQLEKLEEENVLLKEDVDVLEMENEEMDMEMEHLVDEIGEQIFCGKDEKKNDEHEGEELEFDLNLEDEEGGSVLQESLTDDDDDSSDDDDDHENKETMLQQVATLQSEKDALQLYNDTLRLDLSKAKSENGDLRKRLDQQQHRMKERSFSHGDSTTDISATCSESLCSSSHHELEPQEALRAGKDELQRALCEIHASLKDAHGDVVELVEGMRAIIGNHDGENQVLLSEDEDITDGCSSSKDQATTLTTSEMVKHRVSAIVRQVCLAKELKCQLVSAVLEESKLDIAAVKKEASFLSDEVTSPYNANGTAEEHVTALECRLEEERLVAASKLAEVESKLDVAISSSTQLIGQVAYLQNAHRTAMEEATSNIAAAKEDTLVAKLPLSDQMAEFCNAKVAAIGNEIHASNEIIQDLESKLKEATDKNDKLSCQLSAQHANCDSLYSQFKAVTVKYNALELEMKQCMYNLENLSRNKENLEVTIAKLEERIQQKIEEVYELNNQIAQSTRQVSSLTQGRNQLPAKGDTEAPVERSHLQSSAADSAAEHGNSVTKYETGDALILDFNPEIRQEQSSSFDEFISFIKSDQSQEIPEQECDGMNSQVRDSSNEVNDEGSREKRRPSSANEISHATALEVSLDQYEDTLRVSYQEKAKEETTRAIQSHRKNDGNTRQASMNKNAEINPDFSKLTKCIEGKAASDKYDANVGQASSKKSRTTSLRRLWSRNDSGKKRSEK